MSPVRAIAALAATFVVIGTSPVARAGDDVDMLLVLAADASYSIDAPKFELQRQGYAKAIVNPRVINAITSGVSGRIAVCVISSGQGARGLPVSAIRRGGRPLELRQQRNGILPSRRQLCWQDSQGRQARRSAGSAVHKGRADREPQDCEGPGPHRPAHAAWPRRRGDRMRRRAFISLLGGAAAWPARAQQSEPMRRIGVLMSTAADDPEGQARIAAFQQGLQRFGWTIGRNVRIDSRWPAG